VPIPVAVVWRRKIVSIAVHIAKQSKRARNFPVSVGIPNALGKLAEKAKPDRQGTRQLKLLDSRPQTRENSMKDQLRYSELRRQASEETDPKKLADLVKKINSILLEEREATLRNNSLSQVDAA